MSLFGTSPDDSPLANSSMSKSKSSLFADDGGFGPASNSSLFADEADGGSPWSMPTPKKAARQDLVKTLLPNRDVPESYIDSYDALLNSNQRVGAGLGLTGVKNVLASSGVSSADQSTILNIVIPGGTEDANGLGRGEFNVLLALIGLAQEGDDVSLDGVDDRRRKLPQPKIAYLDELKTKKESEAPQSPAPVARSVTPPPAPSPKRADPPPRQESMNGFEADPWGSPLVARSQPAPRSNGFSNVQSASNGLQQRTTSAYTTHSQSPTTNGQSSQRPQSSGSGWDATTYNGAEPGAGGFANAEQAGLGGGFGQPPDEQGGAGSGPSRPTLGEVRSLTSGPQETVTITMLPEKEGVFLFQHRNYEVKSVRRGSSVVRRYSDFTWLLDCLHKRYPFRQLPLLPPKRVAVNGTHLAADTSSFLEKRRRGLVRFANVLVRHPVLSKEQLVVMFLTVPTELSVWRKQATISVQEEFVGKALPPDLEDSLSPTLNDLFDTVRHGVKRSAEVYINLCSLLERLAKRNEGLAADNLRFSLALQSLTEASNDTYAVDTNDVPLLNEGIHSTAKHLSASQTLLEDEARAWDEGVLEDLKKQRDCLVAMREMFDRRDRYARDNIPQLERRIENNQNRLTACRNRPEGPKPGEAEKIEESIMKDKESIIQQHARGVFIKECIRDELVYFQSSQYNVSRLHQDWSQERVKYAELQADNWRALSEEVEGMPLGES